MYGPSDSEIYKALLFIGSSIFVIGAIFGVILWLLI